MWVLWTLLGRPNYSQYCTEKIVNGLKNPQKIGEANGMPNLPIVAHTGHVKGRRPNYSHLTLGGRILHCEGREWPKKSAKNWANQWYAQSTHWAHSPTQVTKTENMGSVHVKGKCGPNYPWSGPGPHQWQASPRLVPDELTPL